MRLVLVDVDGTLVDGQSYSTLLRQLWARRWRRPRLIALLARRLPYQLLRRMGLASRLENQERWARGMAWLLAGAEVSEVQRLFSAASHLVEHRLRHEVVAELQALRAGGYRVILASTSIEPWIAELARFVQVDGAVGTRPEVKDGRYTGRLDGPACNGIWKPRYAEALARTWDDDIDWEQSYAYSDGLPDLPMLERVGHPVVIDPDPELAVIAARRSWRSL